MTSFLFRHIERLHGKRPWGRFLDAGSGVSSSRWSTALPTDCWVGVTASRDHARQIAGAVEGRLRPHDRLLVDAWSNPALLNGESFDTVLADYLLGAVEGFTPYFQPLLFRRLRMATRGRLYIVGLDPYVVGEAPDEAARMTRRIGRLRDAALLLADETPYREYPAEWVTDALAGAGFRVVSARRFANRYREGWVNGQLDMALRRLPFLDAALRASFEAHIETVRGQALELCAREDGLRAGHDYVIACEPRDDG